MSFVRYGVSYTLILPPDAPPQLDIHCPRCGAHAVFDEPFEFYGAKHGKPVRETCDPVTPWRRLTEPVDLSDCVVKIDQGRFVVEKYPAVLPWAPPLDSAYIRGTGVVKCSGCHGVFAHRLNWPEDAYYYWSVRGAVLWAWSEDHARALLEFLGSSDRNPSHYPSYQESLARLPRTVLLAKNRDLVVKQISHTLEKRRADYHQEGQPGVSGHG